MHISITSPREWCRNERTFVDTFVENEYSLRGGYSKPMDTFADTFMDTFIDTFKIIFSMDTFVDTFDNYPFST